VNSRTSALALLAALWLSGCGSGLHGSYSDRMGAMQYRFKSGGNVSVAVMGIATELKYTVEGKHVKIISPQGDQILDLMDDGTLEGPLGMKFTKQE
jgi:hypothetical protein